MLNQLKNLNVDRLALDEALSLIVFGKALRAEYEARGITEPEWLADSLRKLNLEITTQTRDALELRLKEIQAQETQLLTASEKRAKLAEERERLTKQLAGASA